MSNKRTYARRGQVKVAGYRLGRSIARFLGRGKVNSVGMREV